MKTPDPEVEVNRMALAMLADEARQHIPHYEGEYGEELREAIDIADEALEADE